MLKRNVLWWMLVLLLITNTFTSLSISIAIVSMVNKRNITVETVSKQNSDIVCPNTTFILREFLKNEGSSTSSNSSQKQNTGFDWTEAEQNTILSGFFRLNYLSIFPGGLLAHRFGSKLVIGYSQFILSMASSLIPFIAEYGPEAVAWVRSVQGLVSTIAAPTAVFTIMGNWSPPEERGKFGSTFMVGIAIGEALGSFLFGYIAEYIHWKYIFYLCSICGIIWNVLWFMLVHDSPAQHPTISSTEREYIESMLKQTSNERKAPIPWKSIITSVPLIICIMSVSSGMWAFIMVNTYSPLYLKTVYGMNSNEIGIVSSVPYFSMIFVALLVAHYGDSLVRNGVMSITSIRKICTFLGCIVAAIPMVIIAFTKCNLTLVIGCILFICVVRVFGNFGAPLGVLDLSPKFAGVIEGIVGTSSAIHLFAFSTAMNYLTKILDIEEMWKIVFLFTGLYCISMNLVYIIFGTSKVQSWNFENQNHEFMEKSAVPGKEMKQFLQS